MTLIWAALITGGVLWLMWRVAKAIDDFEQGVDNYDEMDEDEHER